MLRVLAFVITCAVYFPISTGNRPNSCSTIESVTRFIRENAEVGSEVYRIPSRGTIVEIQLESGNKHGRFRFNITAGVIAVAGLLDYHAQNNYILDIRVDFKNDKNHCYNLSVVIIDDPGWPPIYNETCAMPHRGFEQLIRLSKYYYALDISVSGKFAGTSSATGNGVPLSLLVSEDKFAMDINNDQCEVRMYWPDKRVGLYLFASLEPDDIQIISCDVRKNHDTSLARWKIYPNPLIERPQSDLIPDSWFSQSGHHEKILNEAFLKQYSSSCTSEWECNVSGITIDVFSFYIRLKPTGCPFGKYGGKCQYQCICRNGATCHPFNGACRCGPGWQGPDCTIPKPELHVTPGDITANIDSHVRLTCTSYHYDVKVMEWYMRRSDDELVPLRQEYEVSVELEFMRAAEHHSGVYECHMTDINNKVKVQTVKVTIKDCQEGFYAPNCDRRCNCQHGASCDRMLGCVCHHGYYGSNCEHQCRCRNNGTCDKERGSCTCQDGNWGSECQNDCPCGPGVKSCAQNTGECYCKAGWGGDYCERRTSASPVDPYENPIGFTTLMAGLICAATIIGMVVVCLVLHYRDKMRYNRMFVHSRHMRNAFVRPRHAHFAAGEQEGLLPAMDDPGQITSESDGELNDDSKIFG